MKAVLLLAGKGRRIQEVIDCRHKSLINIDGKPLLWYLVDNLIADGIDEIVPIIGYRGHDIIDSLSAGFPDFRFEYVWNRDYENSNNMVSLLMTKSLLSGKQFICINGDMLFDRRIVSKIVSCRDSAIAIDTMRKHSLIDSPATRIVDGRVYDLGRDIPHEENDGYAIGIYKFGNELSGTYFENAEKLADQNRNLGFHDPLRKLFASNVVECCDVEDLFWMDIDTEEDIEIATQNIHKVI